MWAFLAFLSPFRENIKHLKPFYSPAVSELSPLLRERFGPLSVEFQLSFTLNPAGVGAFYVLGNAFPQFFPNKKINDSDNTTVRQEY